MSRRSALWCPRKLALTGRTGLSARLKAGQPREGGAAGALDDGPRLLMASRLRGASGYRGNIGPVVGVPPDTGFLGDEGVYVPVARLLAKMRSRDLQRRIRIVAPAVRVVHQADGFFDDLRRRI